MDERSGTLSGGLTGRVTEARRCGSTRWAGNPVDIFHKQTSAMESHRFNCPTADSIHAECEHTNCDGEMLVIVPPMHISSPTDP